MNGLLIGRTADGCADAGRAQERDLARAAAFRLQRLGGRPATAPAPAQQQQQQQEWQQEWQQQQEQQAAAAGSRAPLGAASGRTVFGGVTFESLADADAALEAASAAGYAGCLTLPRLLSLAPCGCRLLQVRPFMCCCCCARAAAAACPTTPAARCCCCCLQPRACGTACCSST